MTTLNIESADLLERVDWLQQQLDRCADVVYHDFIAGPGTACMMVYLQGMIDLKAAEQSVLKVMSAFDSSIPEEHMRQLIFDEIRLPIPLQTINKTVEEALTSLMEGNLLLLVDGEPRILALSIAAFENRSIVEASNETVIRGPREAFIENMETNLTLLRRRLKTPDFKIEKLQLGQKTKTWAAVTYLEGVCSSQLLDEVRKRLSQIKIDGVLGSSYLEEMIDDNPYSPFPQMQYTERPDVAGAALLEGRVVILVDGTPIVIIAPVTMFMLMQSAEDYYQRYISASWIRMIRYLFLFLSILLPSFYVAITTFHPDIIPQRLLITIAASREIVPFPALIEALIMELSFEALREATIRIPKAIGQSVSIIGALIIGTAAVDAGIVSAAMVIIVALTGIASFLIPHFDLGLAFRLLRFPIMILAGLFGLFGIACGMILLYLHLSELRSFGVPYLAPFAPLHPKDLKDTVVRAPWWAMVSRPSFFGRRFKRRLDGRRWEQKQDPEGELKKT
jgi:spore germination protein